MYLCCALKSDVVVHIRLLGHLVFEFKAEIWAILCPPRRDGATAPVPDLSSFTKTQLDAYFKALADAFMKRIPKVNSILDCPKDRPLLVYGNKALQLLGLNVGGRAPGDRKKSRDLTAVSIAVLDDLRQRHSFPGVSDPAPILLTLNVLSAVIQEHIGPAAQAEAPAPSLLSAEANAMVSDASDLPSTVFPAEECHASDWLTVFPVEATAMITDASDLPSTVFPAEANAMIIDAGESHSPSTVFSPQAAAMVSDVSHLDAGSPEFPLPLLTLRGYSDDDGAGFANSIWRTTDELPAESAL
jgi:hypothetical protein